MVYQYQILAKHSCGNFGMITLNRNIKTEQTYMNIDSFVIHIKADDFYEDIADDVEEWFDTSIYSKDDRRPLLIGWNKKVIGLSKDELAGKIMKEFVGLRAKAWACLMDDDSEYKKSKGTKNA